MAEKQYITAGDAANEYGLSVSMVCQLVDNPANQIKHFRTPGSAKKNGERRIHAESLRRFLFKEAPHEMASGA